MTNEEWESSDSANNMLSMLHNKQPYFLRTQIRQIHKFLIACCWKHKHLIPQDGLRDGLKGAEKWLAGEIDYTEMARLDYNSEADAFLLDYCKNESDIAEIQNLIDNIEEVRDMPFDDARSILKDAAYFANGTMNYPFLSTAPWVDSLFESDFLCPDLLREYLSPNL